jgi:hypothetical protein
LIVPALFGAEDFSPAAMNYFTVSGSNQMLGCIYRRIFLKTLQKMHFPHGVLNHMLTK